MKTEYRAKMDDHLEQMRDRTRGAGMDYHLLVTDQPLDTALSEYLAHSPGRATDGISAHGFWRPGGVGLPVYVHLLRKQTTTPAAGEFADVL